MVKKNPIVKKTKENATKRNIEYYDKNREVTITQPQFAKLVKAKRHNYDEFYYTRMQNGVLTPCSKPNNTTKDNTDTD